MLAAAVPSTAAGGEVHTVLAEALPRKSTWKAQAFRKYCLITSLLIRELLSHYLSLL